MNVIQHVRMQLKILFAIIIELLQSSEDARNIQWKTLIYNFAAEPVNPMDVYDSDYYGGNEEAVIPQKNKPQSDSSFEYDDHGGSPWVIF